MLFKKKHDDGVPPEELQNIRVMQDDVDELTGKPSNRKAVPVQKPDGSPDASLTGNPFLGNAETAGKSEQAKDREPVELKNVPMPASSRDGFLGREPVVSKDVPSPVSPETVARKSSMSGIMNRWIIPAVSILLVLVVALGAYLFFFVDGNRSSQEGTSPSPVPADNAVVSNASDAVPNSGVATAPFSVTNPNYLQVDIESANMNSDSIKAILDETASKIVLMPSSVPVRFLIRDANNNPIAFSRFAYLIGLKVPEAILSDIDETFFLYFVLDGGVVRRSVVVQSKDDIALKVAVLKSETSLPAIFASLLYGGNRSVPASSVFHDGTYGSLPTRYTNIDPATGLSFDSAFSGKQWVIGTSKDSFRSVLGQIVRDQSQNVSQ